MAITIYQVTPETLGEAASIDNSFVTSERVRVDAVDGKITLSFQSMPPFLKRYPPEDCVTYMTAPGHALFLARLDGQPAGRLMVRVNWNGFGYIEDIAVAPELRRQGVARRLMQQAIDWTRAQGRPGILLETSDINAAACRFYARCGFELHGFDSALYRGSDEPLDEVALFWYLLF